MKPYEHIHMVGIGGIGMSALARMLLSLGYTVSGSDIREGPIVEELRRCGVRVRIGHSPDNVKGAHCLVYSSSIRPDNTELITARSLGIPAIHRGEMLAILMDPQRGIAVTGTHGKSTTTAMLGYILDSAGWDPSVYVGAIVPKYKSNAKSGLGDWFLSEADESDASFLRLNPEIAVVTNIDSDHMDYYGNRQSQLATFKKFLEKIPTKGFGVVSADDPSLVELCKVFKKRLFTFGIQNPANCMARNITSCDFSSSFDLIWFGENLGQINLRVPGEFNVQNALAASATALALNVSFDSIRAGLGEYQGISRRFEIHKNNGFMVIDDYAHHPTEIKSTLAGARETTDRRIIAVFQPHRYTRTQYLYEEYGKAFDDANIVVVTDIYPAGERPIENVSSKLVVDALRRYSKAQIVELDNLEDVVSWLKEEVRPGDIVITLGAGDVYKVAEALAHDSSLFPEFQEPLYQLQTG